MPTTAVTLPDDWAITNPGHDGLVSYRVAFRFAEATLPDELLALYVDRACTNLQVLLNGHLIYSSGRMAEPISRNCARPQLITLPPALLNPHGNSLDLRVLGHPAESVGSIRRAGGLSAIQLGLQSTLAKDHAARTFWEPAWIRGTSLVLVGLGCLLLAIGWLHKREVYFAYFGWLCLGWAVDVHGDLDPGPALGQRRHRVHAELGWPLLLACAVQFFLSFAGLRSRTIENIVALQWVAVPLSLLVAGHDLPVRGGQRLVRPARRGAGGRDRALPGHGAAAAAAGRRPADGRQRHRRGRPRARARRRSGVRPMRARCRSPNAWFRHC